MQKTVNAILRNKDIEKNLSGYPGEFMEINNRYSSIRFAMNYYTCYVMVKEDKNFAMRGCAKVIDSINAIVRDLCAGNKDNFDKDVSDIEKIRSKVVEDMQDLTGYTDRFNICEYVLNRLQYRYEDGQLPDKYTDESMASKMMEYILKDRDNAEINRKTTQVIGQLPVRFTKKKFYELISNAVDLYKDKEQESLKGFLYRVRMVSMLEKTDTMAENYPDLEEAYQNFMNLDLKNITKDEYNDVKESVLEVTRYISSEMDDGIIVQELINDLLVLLYTDDHRSSEKDIDICRQIISETNLLCFGKVSNIPTEDIEGLFVKLEGLQEEIAPKLDSADITDQIRDEYGKLVEDLGLTAQYDVLYRISRLGSDSIFMPLESSINKEMADEKVIEDSKKALILEYDALFLECDRKIRQAVMSAAISELPLFLSSATEIQNFICDSLSLCNDKAEKTACVEILNQIAEE